MLKNLNKSVDLLQSNDIELLVEHLYSSTTKKKKGFMN